MNNNSKLINKMKLGEISPMNNKGRKVDIGENKIKDRIFNI